MHFHSMSEVREYANHLAETTGLVVASCSRGIHVYKSQSDIGEPENWLYSILLHW